VSPIDLRSDTVTRPTQAMREAMARAEVGDDVFGDDPSVNLLQERAAALMGKEAALFVPSGTMANQLAVRTHTEPGDAIVAVEGAHVHHYEGGAAAALAGVQVDLVGSDGCFSADDLRGALHPNDVHYARTRLVWIENTHNRSGGRVFPRDAQRAVSALAREAGLALHLDGARIFNASTATGLAVAELAAEFDSVSFCLSKGLGAPVGSLLCGSARFIERARRFRKMYGGGMRQAGVLAAAGLHALDHHVKRIAEDHALAALLAQGIAAIRDLELLRAPETNMVLFRCASADSLVSRARAAGLLLGSRDARTVRAVTHLDVDREGIERAVAILGDCASEARAGPA
jgi:threonine aldolase